MTDRDKLIKLLIEAGVTFGTAGIADYLLANGVFILPEDLRDTEDFSISAFIEAMQMYNDKDQYIKTPCKVGDRYVIDTAKTIFNAWNDVTGALVEGTSWYYELESVIEDIVKLSFGAGVLYREEAEQELKKRCNND